MDLFRIGEFSKLTQVSVRMLRYYDEVGLLKPAETAPFTGYRLYAAQQIPQLNRILFLRDVGFNVAEIAAALPGWDDARIVQRLEQKRHEIEQAVKAQQQKLAKIEQAKADILQEKMAIHYNVSIKSIPSYAVFSLRRRVPDYYAEGLLWKEMAAYAEAHTIAVSENTFTIYHDTDYRESDIDIEVCAPVAALGQDADGFTFRHTEEAPLMASTMVYGPFENIAGAFYAVADWLQAHRHYKMLGLSRQIVHRGPWNEQSAEHYLTEIQIPLERTEDSAPV